MEIFLKNIQIIHFYNIENGNFKMNEIEMMNDFFEKIK